MTGAILDIERCEALAARAADAEVTARRALIELLWPEWLRQIRANKRMGPLYRSEDHVRNVATQLMEKLERHNGHALHQFALWRERHPGKSFADWNRIVVANAIRNYAKAQLGAPTSPDAEPSPRRLLNEFASSTLLDELGMRPGATAAQTAREVLEFAKSRLTEIQHRVLCLWLQGGTAEEMADQLKLSPESVYQLQKAAIARLRREFAESARFERHRGT